MSVFGFYPTSVFKKVRKTTCEHITVVSPDYSY